ncbi:MAG: DegT/DnrJ/EryC1/StrS family aminotransferase [Candidatus Omnitrophica bacterium]|nr:DegT/DnrJ/EryC1/StrS family aminotransferase [Candidatus Omnitrophota bacterium]
MKVPFLDLRAQHQSIQSEIFSLWEKIYQETAFVSGAFVRQFEREFAKACQVEHAVAVGNGTEALRLALVALGVKPGDEIIVPPNTFIATTEAIEQAGGKIVFVDIHPGTYNIDVNRIEEAVTPKTAGILPVHLYGQTADMDPILEIAEQHGLWVLEDASQAHLAEYKGRKAGSMGTAAAFSFYPGKNLGACGEAGAVTTNSPKLAQRVAMLRNHGQREKYIHELSGYNSRCDELQAAALSVKLKHLPKWNEMRRRCVQRYRQRLQNINGVKLPHVLDGALPVWHLFVIQVANRDAVAQSLQERGVGVGFHYPVALHLQGAYRWMGHDKGAFPVTEEYTQKLLSLPMFPEMDEEQIDYVCDALIELVRS